MSEHTPQPPQNMTESTKYLGMIEHHKKAVDELNTTYQELLTEAKKEGAEAEFVQTMEKVKAALGKLYLDSLARFLVRKQLSKEGKAEADHSHLELERLKVEQMMHLLTKVSAMSLEEMKQFNTQEVGEINMYTIEADLIDLAMRLIGYGAVTPDRSILPFRKVDRG